MLNLDREVRYGVHRNMLAVDLGLTLALCALFCSEFETCLDDGDFERRLDSVHSIGGQELFDSSKIKDVIQGKATMYDAFLRLFHDHKAACLFAAKENVHSTGSLDLSYVKLYFDEVPCYRALGTTQLPSFDISWAVPLVDQSLGLLCHLRRRL